MEPGDLILTPSWSWHDHGNETKDRIVWMDGLDIPLIASLEAMFFQFYTQPQVPASRPAHTSQALYGTGQLNPTWIKEKTNASPLLLYSWEQTWKALDALRGQTGSPFDGIALEYRHPQTGGSVLPTMACRIQLLRPNEHTKRTATPAARSTMSSKAKARRSSTAKLRLAQRRHHRPAALVAA